MPDDTDKLPDLARGVPATSVPEGGLLGGRVGDRAVVLCRVGGEVHAHGGVCPHLGAPLHEGVMADGVLRCPWHHACFDIRTGAALAAPAFDDLPRFPVEERDGLVVVGEPADPTPLAAPAVGRPAPEDRLVIVGGGAAGFAAADALGRAGRGRDTLVLSADADPPYDRTLLTKDYLDGRFGDDRLPMARHGLDALGVRVELSAPVEAIDVEARTVHLADGRRQPYAKLLLATGAEPRRPDLPGADLPHVHVLRSLADCRRILGAAGADQHVVVLGGSFIGLEAAASLRSRGLEVDLVTPDEHPMERVFGRAVSDLAVEAHRAKGVRLHLGRRIARIEPGAVTLDDGKRLGADLVLAGIGVEPRTALAEAAGLDLDRDRTGGIVVDSRLRTSAPDVYAAGDIACWPDPHGGQAIRVEHWAVAERQGQTAAANMLGADQAFEAVPFFWTKQFDLAVRYVGHADRWDEIAVEGNIGSRDALLRYRRDGRILAVATLGREGDSLREEAAMEQRLRAERGRPAAST